MEKKTIWDLQRPSVEEYRSREKRPIAVVLDNIRSLNNVGSVFRSSDAMGVAKICLCGITATPPSPEIHKTALGAEDSVEWKYYSTTLEAFDELRSEGYVICTLEQVKQSTPLHKFKAEPGKRYAIVVGHEVNGVDPEVVNNSDVWLEIPQEGTKHSLNVSVSLGMALWQVYSSILNQD